MINLNLLASPIPTAICKKIGGKFRIIEHNRPIQDIISEDNRLGEKVTISEISKIFPDLHNHFRMCIEEKRSIELESEIKPPEEPSQYKLKLKYTSPELVAVELFEIKNEKKNEISLIENEMKFHSLFDLSPIGFALNRLSDGQFVEGNRALFQTVGYSEEEFSRLSYWDVTPKEYEKQEIEALESLKNNGYYGPYEKEYIHKDGHRFPVLLQGVLTTGTDGEKYIFSTVQDLTDHRNSEKSIQDLGKILEESLNEIYIFDVNSYQFKFTNKGAQLNLGYSGEELLTMSPLEVQSSYDIEEFSKLLEPLKDGTKNRIVHTTQHQRKDISLYDVEMHLQKSIFQDEDVYIAFVLDITERTRAEELLNKLSMAVEQSPNAIYITSLDGKIEYANRKFEEINGYSKSEYHNKSPAILKSDQMSEHFYDNILESLAAEKDWFHDVCNKRKDGSLYWAREHITFVRDKNNKITHFLSLSQDITKTRENELKILHQANYDQLTNVPNRFLGKIKLKESIEASRKSNLYTVILFIDLDNFKNINDNLGHVIGDQVLIETANRLKSIIRKTDTVVRFGGDEFLIILSGVKKLKESEVIVRKIHDAFEKPYKIEKSEIYVTTSSGISVSPVNGFDPDELIRFADAAMYYSKERGRNIFHYFTSEMESDIKNRFELEREMRNALSRNEFTVVYQPFFNLETGQIVGAEALLRWKNKKLGPVSPNVFIPVAEQTGLIESIGEFVLLTACRQVKAWEPLISNEFQMSINISPRQFRDGTIINLVKSVLEKTGLNPHRVKLEVTEGLLIQAHDRPVEMMKKLKNLGIGIAMDDFGTEVSSLQNLRLFSFDLLKIDKSFISDIIEKPDDRAMVEAIIAMCKSLKISVIAEGIETQAQKEIILQSGCLLGQGYLFSKPIGQGEFTTLLQS